MIVEVPYGKEHIDVEIAEKNLIGVYYPNEVESHDYKKMMDEVLEKEKFSEFIKTEEKIIFIVNDGTRPTPTAKVLEKNL